MGTNAHAPLDLPSGLAARHPSCVHCRLGFRGHYHVRGAIVHGTAEYYESKEVREPMTTQLSFAELLNSVLTEYTLLTRAACSRLQQGH
jgi:hypothetical protein